MNDRKEKLVFVDKSKIQAVIFFLNIAYGKKKKKKFQTINAFVHFQEVVHNRQLTVQILHKTHIVNNSKM